MLSSKAPLHDMSLLETLSRLEFLMRRTAKRSRVALRLACLRVSTKRVSVWVIEPSAPLHDTA
ncbi:hypothetical protein PN498_21210 [Oscillatoria sp. CS-180]|uniref:hypothetical protein n=1 Tax=Oscillatoria sp. CS-180 TaxID=3021720 RepID=UPI00232AC72C|nr:hypothetical protein [Oscillatoria sp. CS-180]MDB9528525.1 hypothetical protein [Oscillatoria sp. CS-180]